MSDPYTPEVGGPMGPQNPSPQPFPKDPEPEPVRSRSPLLAGLLSVIPGLGQIYNGRYVRGVAYFVLVVVMGLLIYWANVTHEFKAFPGMIPILIGMLGLFWLWVAVSAVFGASGSPFAPATGLILVLMFTYFMGWQVTEINLEKFFTEFPDSYNILTRVLWPWEAAIDRPEEHLEVTTDWMSPCPEEDTELPPQTPGDSAAPWITIDPACGNFSRYDTSSGVGVFTPGTELTIHGEGFAPEQEVDIWVITSIGNQFRPQFGGENVAAITDDQGNFEVTFDAPNLTIPDTIVGPQIYQFQGRQLASVGNAEISKNFLLAVNRMIVTIFQALMATTFGIVLALPFSFLAARNLMWANPITRGIYYLVRFTLNVVRSIEPIIWAVIAVVWVGLGPFAGVIALTLHTIASLGKLYSEAIENIDSGPIEAINATGANHLQMIMYAIIPQVIPPFLSFTVYRWDINVRMSTIIGAVGGGGIGQILFQWMRTSQWREAGMAAWLIVLTVSLMDWASSELRKRYV